jgi:hydroxymethylpyrimidine/phosphomethylpyrimidine kinase
MKLRGRVLIIAGSDSGGGAGIQADVKTACALGGHAMTAITALTAQNSRGVFGIHEVPPEFVARQIALVVEDFGVDCVKIGMLHRAEVIDSVCDALGRIGNTVPVVVDPVMVAKGGHPLLQDAAAEALRQRLLPIATVLTPNLPEAETLAGQSYGSPGELAARLLQLGPAAVLVKGGHGEGPMVRDVLAMRGQPVATFESPRLDTRHTHGTGCTLASAISTGLAQGLDVYAAVLRARAYVQCAMQTAPGFGQGHGPLNHAHTVQPFDLPENG